MTGKTRTFQAFSILAAALALLLFPGVSRAKYIGAEPPACQQCKCTKCGNRGLVRSAGPTDASVSHTEGNMSEQYNVVNLKSGFGSTVSLSLNYNSYNADGSRAQLDLGMGYGWTHSYNIFLFNQLGNMFRMDGEGRVTKYQYQTGGTFTAATGYFETLVNNMDGTFTLRQKDGTTYLFAQIPNTPFLIVGPVYRLTRVADRNNNATAVSYDSSGNLSQVTDTYGRTLTFSYNAQHELTEVTDPLGRTTTFGYDSSGRRLAQITDPQGKVVQYSYNTLSQITQEVDKDGRTFTFGYHQQEPTAITDGAHGSYFNLSNPTNWATDGTSLAEYQLRVYTPSTTSDTDGRGHVWKYSYDSNGYVNSVVAPDGATTTYTYDPLTLMPASMTDADGNTTTYKYDSEGNLIQSTDALGFVTTYTYEPVFNQITSVTDPNGRTTTYTYDSRGNRLSETDPLGHSETWTYDSHGNVLTDTDKDGHTTTYQYDSFGDRIQTTDPLGNITRMTYDAVGNLLSRTDANGHTTSYVYDGLDRVIQVTDPLGKTTTTVYDGEGDRIKVTDRDGNTTQYQYDQRSRLIKTTDALSQTTTSTYDGNNNTLSMTDKDGHTTTMSYDVQNRLLKTTDALGNTTAAAYDPVGNVVKTTDANGHTTRYTYDALNRVVTSIDAVGSVTTTVYDVSGPNTGPCLNVCTGPTQGSGLPSEVIDGDGHAALHVGVTYYKYDGLDRVIQVVRKQFNSSDDEPPDPTDAVTYTTYDPVGNVLTMTEPDANTTTDVYDADNRKIMETNAAGDVTTWAYDGVGNVTSMTAPTTNVAVYTYDADDRVIKITDGGGMVVSDTYDAVGNRISQTDGNGNTTTVTYDAIYRVVETTDPLGQNTSYDYDPVGNLLLVTDRNGNATSYAYDAVNRRTSMTDAIGDMTQYQYDHVSNVTKLTDANGDATTYAYDAMNRRTSETYADGLSRHYTYDFVGNLTSRKDQNGHTTTYTYSDLYFLLQRTYPSSTDVMAYDLSGRMLSATRGGWPVTFTYDGANRVLTSVQNGETVSYSYNIPARIRTVTYPGGRVITESMDLRSRLAQIDDPSSPPPIVQYSYDAGDRVTARKYRNGTSASFTYNNNDWVTALQHNLGAIPIAGFGYAYDNEGIRQNEQKFQDPAHSESYQYDNIYRLTDYKSGAITHTQYTLDPVGNWPKKVTNGNPEFRTHNAVNEITTINGHPLAYDHNGNLTKDMVYSYAYDEENRLTSVTRNSDSRVVGQYQYDALSRRVQKIANPASPPSPTTTRYFYDDARIIEEQDAGEVTQATYVYGNYIDEVLTMDRGGQPYYYHQNALWSVEAVTNSAGSPVERYEYDAYGLVTVLDGSFNPLPLNAWGTPHSALGNPYLYTGRQLDEEGGLYLYRARYYDGAKGRFLQRDRIEYGDGMNLYQYAKDSPANYSDWDGKESVTVILGSARCALGSDFATPTQGLGQGLFVVQINNRACDKGCTEAHEATHVASESSCCKKAREKYEQAKKANNNKEANDVIKKWNDEYARPGWNWSECNARTCEARCLEKLVKDRDCATCFQRVTDARQNMKEEDFEKSKAKEDYECCNYLLGHVIRRRGGRIKEVDEARRDYCSREDAKKEPDCPFAENPAPENGPGTSKGGLGCFVGSSKGPGINGPPMGEGKGE